MDYLIGIDGRVRASNSVSDALITKELGRYRLAKLGSVPTSMNTLKGAVEQGRMGAALKAAETAAKAPGAGADVKAVAQRTREIAEETLDARTHWADVMARKGRKREAASAYAAVKRAFAGTSLAAEAARREAEFTRRQGR